MPTTETDAYYRLLCENLGIALITIDLDFTIRTWNTAAMRTFGAAAERMVGTPLLSVIPQDRRDLAHRYLKQAAETGETIQFEFEHRDAQGAERELAATIAPVVNESGERIGLSMCVRDITLRIQLQGELSDNRKMVALGEMAGAVAHHFNNILGGIVTSIDFIRTSYDPVMTRRVLEQVQEALMRATSVLDGLLAFAEGNRRAEDLSDFTEIILELAKIVDVLIEGKSIEFDLQIATLPVMPFPRIQVLTALRNIVQNAIEAMQEGGTLRIEVTRLDDQVVVKIEDTGCGFDPSESSRIFEPFWSTKGVLKDGGEQAVGLGLAITHGLINMLGGSISTTSSPGRGSTFQVKLPMPGET